MPASATARTTAAAEAGEDDTEETTAAAAGTATIATATTGEETEAVDTEGETGVVPWTTEATAEETAITTTEAGEEEATDIATIADAETTFAEDATDRPTGEDLPGAAGSIAGAAAPGADRRRAAETTAGRTEEAAEATRETAVLLPAGAMTIATGVATKIIGAAATRTTSAGALRRPTAETIAAETIAVTVARESRDENKTKQNQNQTENDVRKVPVELHSFGGFVRNLSGNRATKEKRTLCSRSFVFFSGSSRLTHVTYYRPRISRRTKQKTIHLLFHIIQYALVIFIVLGYNITFYHRRVSLCFSE